MAPIYTEAAAIIEAPPEQVYAIFADYRVQHPRILPPEHFPSLEVEQGGMGAGTIIRVRSRALGMERAYRMVVSEPEPGRVLAETDTDAGLVTTFSVEPLDGGQRCRVVIASTWAAKGGLMGVIEKIANPRVARRMYQKELRRLAEYVRTKGAATPAEGLPTSE